MAIARRDGLRDQLKDTTDALRLIHSGADGVPGITVDMLGGVLLVEAHLKEADVSQVVHLLVRRFGDTPIFCKERWSHESAGRAGTQIHGPVCSPELWVREENLMFRLHLTREEHIGLFLDSRAARAMVRTIAAGRRVLNLFSYTGAFGVAAQAGGARSTTNVDNKRSALATAQINYEANGLPWDTRTFLRGDAFKYLTRALRGKGSFDLVILDPPPNSKRPGNRWFRAKTGYGPLAAKCIGLLDTGGLLLAGLNASSVSDGEFEDMVHHASELAHKPLETVRWLGPGEDFPPCDDRPVARFALCSFGTQGD